MGKTHLKHLLLDKQPPHLRTSTICAETPIRIQLRTITGMRIQNLEGTWKDEGMLDVVANMILLVEPEVNQRSDHSWLSRTVNFFLQRQESTATGATPPTLSPPPKRKGTRKSDSSTHSNPSISDTCRKAMKKIMDKLVSCITKLKSESHPEGSSQPSTPILSSKWLYFTDSGGQPQYHELLPLFVHHISSALCVTRLTDKLDEVQVVELYSEGDRVGAAQLSQLSVKDTIQCLANTIQSYSAQDQPPKIIMVGTHIDKLKETLKQPEADTKSASESFIQTSNLAQSHGDSETLEEKDKKLLQMLEPEFSDQLVFYSRDMKKLLFPLNTLNPGEREKAIAQSSQHAVETSEAREVKIPIWWYIMELLLQELAKELGRGVLGKVECLEMARLLNIREDFFNAALKFFDELNIIKYSPDVLPNVVFIDSQIPLDKVSELVYHSYLLRQPTAGEPLSPIEGEWKHFRDHGVVSKKDLESLTDTTLQISSPMTTFPSF